MNKRRRAAAAILGCTVAIAAAFFAWSAYQRSAQEKLARAILAKHTEQARACKRWSDIAEKLIKTGDRVVEHTKKMDEFHAESLENTYEAYLKEATDGFAECSSRIRSEVFRDMANAGVKDFELAGRLYREWLASNGLTGPLNRSTEDK
jgi:hypothetical protein